ncbi:hypothetical protein O6H91_09G030400 [Diphasiastrum complanatum]|uniref:Uncharacterized protein n=1 Tax=Diphasiastrum complanatum TaxID=34168 RepID=A0ACC2CMK6_DIPCM|nr:hypothetical protein O6H91_09G030400 [Diphasiastrum complanatum]
MLAISSIHPLLFGCALLYNEGLVIACNIDLLEFGFNSNYFRFFFCVSLHKVIDTS